MGPNTIIQNHPDLGKLRGLMLPDGLVQFRNIIYAQSERWKPSKRVDDLRPFYGDDGSYNATIQGTIPPQNEDSINFDFDLIQERLPVQHKLHCDENNCLNLNLTLPATDAQNLPVIVFIHGGGFMIGSNGWPQYDVAELVKLSQKDGKPIIGIGINYRLGLLGFLASREISGDDTIGNFGLLDQANALEWVQRHIEHFGGDPANVTVFGESAGAISIWQHLLRGERLFNRAMPMSGDPRLRPVQSVENNESVYHAFIAERGLQDASTAERKSALLGLPWQKIVASPLNFRTFPTYSGGFKPLREEPADIGQQISECLSWCKTIVVGDCELDATVMAPTLRQPDWFEKFKAAFGEFFEDDEIQGVIDFYGLANPHGSEDFVHMGLLQMVTDVRFYLPVVIAQDSIPADANLHVYHFHEPNPFAGLFRNRTGHVLDVAYTMQTYQHLLPKEASEVSRYMGRYLLSLAYGELDADNKKRDTLLTRLYDTDHTVKEITSKEYDRKFRGGAGALLKLLGIKRLVQALDLFQFGIR